MQTDKIIIHAGGGLVRDKQGRFLMIYRLDRWDLPKGKKEEGESIEQCALREVSEECGITPTMGQKLCVTIHHYELDGQMVEKQTTWFSMTTDDTKLTAQAEEGIENCQWVEQSEIEDRLKQSYSTIREVFRAFND